MTDVSYVRDDIDAVTDLVDAARRGLTDLRKNVEKVEAADRPVPVRALTASLNRVQAALTVVTTALDAADAHAARLTTVRSTVGR